MTMLLIDFFPFHIQSQLDIGAESVETFQRK